MKFNELYLLRLNGILLGPMMVRNIYKSNVIWESYPFLPPTSASGLLAAVLEGERWHEKNGLKPRQLHRLPNWETVWALGAYPDGGNFSRLHYRNHVGSLKFNYEAHVWKTGQGIGKKLATVQEYYAEQLQFVIVSSDVKQLEEFQSHVIGRLARIGKKGCIQITYSAPVQPTNLKKGIATGNEDSLGIIPFVEVGDITVESARLYAVPVTLSLEGKEIWSNSLQCLWSSSFGDLRFRSGVEVYHTEESEYAISNKLLESICSEI
ncbi:hypothetical protein C6501_17530 [Candidatus Poribacteria bacterium]|nr:MAG: hypothetical protein C6501_17530 [Candidatus Poribacteria bacterium]